jgi:uncharacterized protein YacL (UPF0231 family)
VGQQRATPTAVDEYGHNVFCYAIKSGNYNLVEMLINHWSNDQFRNKLDKLDRILSTARDELKIKDVMISDEMYLFLEKKLLNLRFFSDKTEIGQNGPRNDSEINIFFSGILSKDKVLRFLSQFADLLQCEKDDKFFNSSNPEIF